MKPIRIEVENWTSYEAAALDFPDGVFLIAGPTGSGKSSLIDAMTFALFGSVPRIGKGRGLGALIRQGTAKATVVFTFDVGERAYRATRTLRAGRQTVLLETRMRGTGGPPPGSPRDAAG